MNLSLRSKLIVLFFVVAFAPVLIASFFIFSGLRDTVGKQRVEDVSRMVRKDVSGLAETIHKYQSMAQLLSRLPPASGIIRALPTGIDPIDQSTLAQWLDRYEVDFIAAIHGTPEINQLMLLDRQGQEVIRVDNRGGNVSRVKPADLQAHQGDIDFKESLKVSSDEVYVSPVTLKKKDGDWALPHSPQMIFWARVQNQDQDGRASLALVSDLKPVLEKIREASGVIKLIVDQDGNFILNPDRNKEFGAMLKTGSNYFKERPELAENSAKADSMEFHDTVRKEFRVWKKLFYNPADETRYWIICEVLPESELFTYEKKILKVVISVLLVSFVLIGLLGVLAAQIIYAPVHNLRKGVGLLMEGQLDSKIIVDSRDEIGDLSDAFNLLGGKIKEMRQGLEEERNRFELVIQSVATGIIIVDQGGIIRMANAQTEMIFGYKIDELIGQSVDILVPMKFRGEHPKLREGYMKKPEKRNLGAGRNLWGTHKNGSQIPVQIGLSPLRTAAGAQVIASIVDLTERQKGEDLLRRKNKDLETILHIISHDLKEPLRSIEYFSTAVCERYAGQLDEDGRDFLTRSAKSAAKMKDLLTQILQISRIRNNETPKEWISGERIVREALERLEERIKKTEARITTSGQYVNLRVDAVWAAQALINLISNAIKYTKPGEKPDIEIAAYSESDEQKGFCVKDRGIGVSKDYQEKIFVLFQRAVGDEVEGVGAGLAIVKEVAEKHEGKAWMLNREGGGSEFYITFKQ